MKPLHPSLLASALYVSEKAARQAWFEWRGQVDIQHLSWPEIQFLPLLNGPRLQEWLAEDEAAGLLKGIVRRAWTESQVRMANARTAAQRLEQAGCGPVILFGAAGLHLRNSVQDAIRPISQVELLIPRASLRVSIQALQEQGWQLQGEVPDGEGLDWCAYIPMHRGGSRLHLHWRVFNGHADRAEACEQEFLEASELVESQNGSFRVLDPAHALLDAMARKAEPKSADPTPWQADCALLPLANVDWARWKQIAEAYHPPAFDRLVDMRSFGLAVPLLTASKPPREPLLQPALSSGIAKLRRWVWRARQSARRLLLVEVKR